MAGIFTVTSEGAKTAASGTTKTLIELMGGTAVKAELLEFGVAFNGVTSTDPPILVELWQITASGTGTAATRVSAGRSAQTPTVTGKYNNTAEPTKGNRIGTWYLHPQGGSIVIQYPLGNEPVICDASTAQGLCLAFVSGTMTAASSTSYMVWRE